MGEVFEVSYTGDLLAHRRCPRAWCYEKYAQFTPHEQAQAMEGRLIHHAMEWLASRYARQGDHASRANLRDQLAGYFRVLWARGIRTAFQSKDETIDRVCGHLFPNGTMHSTVAAAVEGAVHCEYELRTVRKIIPGEFAGKSRLMLTGILDLVIQQGDKWVYPLSWHWQDRTALAGKVIPQQDIAYKDDVEIWDYKGTRADSPYLRDYVLQLLTYAGLYAERTSKLPARCVLFFINEPVRQKQLISISIDRDIVNRAQKWTMDEAKRLRDTMLTFEQDPLSIEGGGLEHQGKPVGSRVDSQLKQQCTACSLRFDCDEYKAFLGSSKHPDVDELNVKKN